MKKLIASIAISAFMISCNDSSSTKTEATSDSSRMDNTMSTDTSMNSMSSSSAMASAQMTEGMTIDKDGHMMDDKGKMMDMMMGSDKKMKDSMKK